MRISVVILFLSLAGCSVRQSGSIETRLDDVVKDFHGSVLVSSQGKIVYRRSLDNNDTTKFLIGSVSKPITAIVILQLADSGLLKLDDTISKYFSVNDSKIGGITIHQLLTHTSGISEIISEKPGTTIIQRLDSATLHFDPGTSFEYSNSAFVILASIIEKVTGQEFPLIVKSMVFDKAGMKHSGVARQESLSSLVKAYTDATLTVEKRVDFPIEIVDGAGTIYSTTGDLLLLDSALRGNLLLSQPMLDLMHTKHVKETYAYGWFVRERGGVWDVYYHPGNIAGFTSFFSRRLNTDQCIILLSNVKDAKLESIESDINRILKD